MRGGKRPGAGRPKGKPNKLTTSGREAFFLAFQGIGGVPAFVDWAKQNQTDFYKLFSRTIPLDITSGGKELAALTWDFGGRKVSF